MNKKRYLAKMYRTAYIMRMEGYDRRNIMEMLDENYKQQDEISDELYFKMLEDAINASDETKKYKTYVYHTKYCAECGEEFYSPRRNGIFCSTKCRVRNHRRKEE